MVNLLRQEGRNTNTTVYLDPSLKPAKSVDIVYTSGEPNNNQRFFKKEPIARLEGIAVYPDVTYDLVEKLTRVSQLSPSLARISGTQVYDVLGYIDEHYGVSQITAVPRISGGHGSSHTKIDFIVRTESKDIVEQIIKDTKPLP